MTIKIEIHPGIAAPPFRAAQNAEIKGSGGLQIAHGKRQMERVFHIAKTL
jgi:hypothetical protein